ncbi:uncharacterized protein LOC120339384 isoform X1 [Styela clava]
MFSRIYVNFYRGSRLCFEKLLEKYFVNVEYENKPSHRKLTPNSRIYNLLTILRKRSCHILQMEEVFTCWAQYVSSPSGNVALASVLRPKTNAYSLETSPRQRGNPVIIINCLLETGYSANQIKVRVSQSLVMMKEAKRIYTGIKTRIPTSIPIVMITGDMNTGNQLPASTSFLDNIYVDVLLESGTGKDTFFYPVPFLIPGLGV